ncbi:hypothetical protein [Pseudogracilibacillus sp. SO30301A]|uniref:hypothetical protein n=1 Tax=Pseudogracilibacillus sp. SO30301A TaxID=3098291 RepID=UPI00300E38E2
MSEHKKKKETKKVESTTTFSDPPVHVHEEETLRQDVERKREEMKNSTIGGF